ncbi:MAG: 6-hydroxymethylpterin diphosphokinase MptE-like protein [Chloroflexota bacterium]
MKANNKLVKITKIRSHLQNVKRRLRRPFYHHPAIPRAATSYVLWRWLRYQLSGHNIFLSKNERLLSRLHDQYAGRRAFILGNGPSLNRHDLTKLSSEVTFGVNNIFLKYAPTYYVVEDYLMAEDRSAVINAYNGSTVKFFGNYLRYCLADQENTLWLNVRYDYTDFPGFPCFSENVLRRVYVGGTVTYICMQLAFYMGFSHVYLVGFDHNYNLPAVAHRDGNRVITDAPDHNHFSPDYLREGDRWHLPHVERMERAYHRARTVYETHGRTIVNATAGGSLAVFERVDYDSLFTG